MPGVITKAIKVWHCRLKATAEPHSHEPGRLHGMNEYVCTVRVPPSPCKPQSSHPTHARTLYLLLGRRPRGALRRLFNCGTMLRAVLCWIMPVPSIHPLHVACRLSTHTCAPQHYVSWTPAVQEGFPPSRAPRGQSYTRRAAAARVPKCVFPALGHACHMHDACMMCIARSPQGSTGSAVSPTPTLGRGW